MSDTRTIVLAGEPVQVPRLPLRLTIKAYPLCRKLANAQFQERYIAATTEGGLLEVTDEELADLAEIACCAAMAANSALTEEEFRNKPVTPPELIDAYFPIRIQTGGWVAADPSSLGEDQDAPGEAKTAETLAT